MARSAFDLQHSEGDFTLQKPSSLVDVAAASFVNAVNMGETSSIFRAIKRQTISRDDDVVPHADLNKQFPNMETPFNEPTSMALAEELDRLNRQRRGLNKIIANGDDNLVNKAVSFGSGIVGAALDPVGIAAGLLIGGGVNKVMALKSIAQPVTKAGMIVKNAAEGVVGNVLSEATVVMPNQRAEQQDIDTYENFTNAVIAGVAFPAVIGAGKASFDFLKSRGQATMSKAFNLTEQQMQLGKRTDLRDFESVTKKTAAKELEADIDRIREFEPDEVVEDAESIIAQAAEIEDINPGEVRERANAREQGLFHDPEADRIYDESINGFTSDVDAEFRAQREELFAGLEDLKRQEDVLDASDIKEIDNLQTELNKIPDVEQAFKFASVCVRQP